VAARPDNADCHNDLGNALRALERWPEAIDAYRRAVDLRPDFVAAWHNLGATWSEILEFGKAEQCFRKSIEIDPKFADAYSGLGPALMGQQRFDEAIESLERALRLAPDSAAAHTNLANALRSLGRLEEASAQFARAIQIAPDLAAAHWNYAWLLLSQGRLAEGWEHYEWRLAIPSFGMNRGFAQPQWDGRKLNGQTVLLHSEGGYGDALHFVRYVPLLDGRGARLILECKRSLLPLFASLPGVAALVAREDALPDFDLHLPIQSLPRLFARDLATIPNCVPYLKPPPERLAHWSRRLEGETRLKVGLVWAGSPPTPTDPDPRTRSIDIFAWLAAARNVRLYNLQKGPESAQARPEGLDLVDYTADLHDWADTAALVQNLDLVLSVDTSTAHLAGALGRPVWVLLPFNTYFLWLRDRTDSPWYPTMRLFRQTQTGDWTKAIESMAAEFHAWMARQGRS
jgi:Tfp pilus assembly protein PilF